MHSRPRISSPLEAGESLLVDNHNIPCDVSEALQYISDRLASKAVHMTLLVARHVGSRSGLFAAFMARVGVNIGLVLVAGQIVGARALSVSDTMFFVLLLSLLITYHDRFAPVGAVRVEDDRSEPDPEPAAR